MDMYHYKIDFLGPLEVSPSGCHHFYEDAQGIAQWALRANSEHTQDMLSEQPCAPSVTHPYLFCASSLI